jgi:hypothetical protein
MRNFALAFSVLLLVSGVLVANPIILDFNVAVNDYSVWGAIQPLPPQQLPFSFPERVVFHPELQWTDGTTEWIFRADLPNSPLQFNLPKLGTPFSSGTVVLPPSGTTTLLLGRETQVLTDDWIWRESEQSLRVAVDPIPDPAALSNSDWMTLFDSLRQLAAVFDYRDYTVTSDSSKLEQYSGTASLVSVSDVPEPTTCLLVVCGIVGIRLYRRIDHNATFK